MIRLSALSLGLGFFALAARDAGAAALDGAEFYSTESVKYGRFEIRMRMAATPGSISSFFTYSSNSSTGTEPWREIDIEVLGKDGKGFQSNLITGTSASRRTSEAFHASSADLSQGFHTYTLDWTPDSIVYRLDGQTVRKTTGADQQVKDLSDRAQTYRMNLWATTEASWAGTLDQNKLPVMQTINWIAYSSYTPGQGPRGSNFTPQWTDEFNSIDTRRWSRGNWTFEGNLADFNPNNAIASGGYLMLILSRKGAAGSPTPPADPDGNTRPPVSLEPVRARVSSRVGTSAGLLRVYAGERPAEIVVATPQGRVLARRAGSGLIEFGGLPHGMLLVRAPGGERLVMMP